MHPPHPPLPICGETLIGALLWWENPRTSYVQFDVLLDFLVEFTLSVRSERLAASVVVQAIFMKKRLKLFEKG